MLTLSLTMFQARFRHFIEVIGKFGELLTEFCRLFRFSRSAQCAKMLEDRMAAWASPETLDLTDS